MTIFVTWQLIVTLDSICNSRDVCICHEAKSLSFHCDQENQTKGWFLFKIGFMCALKGWNYKTQWQKRVENQNWRFFTLTVRCLLLNSEILQIEEQAKTTLLPFFWSIILATCFLETCSVDSQLNSDRFSFLLPWLDFWEPKNKVFPSNRLICQMRSSQFASANSGLPPPAVFYYKNQSHK